MYSVLIWFYKTALTPPCATCLSPLDIPVSANAACQLLSRKIIGGSYSGRRLISRETKPLPGPLCSVAKLSQRIVPTSYKDSHRPKDRAVHLLNNQRDTARFQASVPIPAAGQSHSIAASIPVSIGSTARLLASQSKPISRPTRGLCVT